MPRRPQLEDFDDPEIVCPPSDQGEQFRPSDLHVSDSELIAIWIVWTVGVYANGVRLLDIRAVTTSKSKAILYSKMLRCNKEPGELWTRVVIEPRCANHLYAEKWREFMVNTGKM